MADSIGAATARAPVAHGRWRRLVVDRLTHAVGGPARRRVVVLLACVLGLQTADGSAIGAIAVPLEKSLHISTTELGLLVTVSTGVGALATAPAGVLTDRVNRVHLLVGAVAAWSLAMGVSGAATSYPVLLVTRVALAAVVGVAGPVVASLTGDLFPASERGRIYGYVLSGELVGAGVGFLVCGDVAAVASWRFSFWVLAVPGLALAAAIWRLLPEPARGGQSQLPVGAEHLRPAGQARPSAPAADGGAPQRPESRVDELVEERGVLPHPELVLHEDPTHRSWWWAARYVLSLRSNRVLVIASALGYFFFAGMDTFAVQLLRERFGLGQSEASTLLVVLGAGALLGSLTTGQLGDRLVRRGHLAARPVVAGASYALAAALLLPGLLAGSLLAAVPLFFLAAGGVGGANPPLDAARLDLVPSRLWGRAESVRTMARSALEAVAPLLFGYLADVLGGAATHSGAASGGRASGSGAGGSGAGLDRAFLVMLVPLAVAGLLLLLRARVTYPRDVATAIASERALAQPSPPP